MKEGWKRTNNKQKKEKGLKIRLVLILYSRSMFMSVILIFNLINHW